MKVVSKSEARGLVLDYFQRYPHRPILIGQLSLWIGNNYGLNEAEALLEEMVKEGVVRLATREELREGRVTHGYMLVAPSKVPA